MTPQARQALQYIFNAGGNATVVSLDDDFEPIGPMLRQEIIPAYATIDARSNTLLLTPAGEAIMSRGVI